MIPLSKDDRYLDVYKRQEWKHDSSMTYVKNPNYWDADNVTVDEMNVLLTYDDVSAYTAYQNGAGKSTLIKAILGEIPHPGTIEFKDTKDGPMAVSYTHLDVYKRQM